MTSPVNREELLANMSRDINRITLSEHIDAFLDYQRRIEDGTQLEGFSWGAEALDDVTLLEPGKLYVVAGSKGTGKTKLAVNVLDENVSNDIPCLFISLEMGSREIIRRFASRRARIDSSRLLRRNLSEADFCKVERALDRLRACPLVLETAAQQTRGGIVECISKWKASGIANDSGLVVVDFLQRITSDSRRRDESDAVSLRDTAYALAGAAKTHRVAIVALAQLNKQADAQRPHIGHLEGSGGPAQAADGLILLDLLRTRIAGKQAVNGLDELDIIVAKNREGESGQTIRCMADLRTGHFHKKADEYGGQRPLRAV